MTRKRLPSPIEIDTSDTELDFVRDNRDLEFTEEELAQAAKKGSKGVGAVVVHHTVTLLQITMVVVLATWAYVTFSESSFLTSTDPEARSALEPYVVNAQIQRIQEALEVHHSLEESYPPTLDTLVERGILQADDLTYPVGQEIYNYQRFGDGYKLFAPAEYTATDDAESEDSLIFEEE